MVVILFWPISIFKKYYADLPNFKTALRGLLKIHMGMPLPLSPFKEKMGTYIYGEGHEMRDAEIGALPWLMKTYMISLHVLDRSI